MKRLAALLLLSVLLCCTKEAVLPDPNSTILTVTSQPAWTTTTLDDKYVIDFPKTYKGGIGPTIDGPEFSLRNENDSVYMLDPLPNLRTRIKLGNPSPTSISYANLDLNRVVTFNRDGQTQGVFYYAEQPETRGRLFLLKNGELVSSLIVQYPIDTQAEVFGILQTIRPK